MARSRQWRWAVLAGAWALAAGAQDAGVASGPEEPVDICGPVEKQAHPDPVALVREFVRRDGKGQFLQTDDWFMGAVSCPDIEPGPDTFTVVRSYKVKPARKVSRDEVRIEVEYDVLGEFGLHFRRAPSRRTRVFTVVRTPYGWRIQSPALNQHVLASERPGLAVEPAPDADAGTGGRP